MVDSCRQLTVSQSNGDEDTAGMVTILTGLTVEELCNQSAAMKVSHSAVCLYFLTITSQPVNATFTTITHTQHSSHLCVLRLRQVRRILYMDGITRILLFSDYT